MKTTLVKKVLNIVITEPFLLALSALSFYLLAPISKYMMFLHSVEKEITPSIVGMYIIFLICLFLGFFFLICCASVIRTGNGIVWKKIDRGWFLQKPDGTIVRIFKKDKMVLRFTHPFKCGKIKMPKDF